MSFSGKLEEFSLAELLQLIAASGETGKLRLTRPDADGILVFRHGKIVYAASSSARQTLGNLLLSNDHVTEEKLNAALDAQVESKEEQRLGTILLDMKAIEEETLKEIVQLQTEKVIGEFMSWDSGYFKLEALELSDYGEIEVDAKDFLMREGLQTEVGAVAARGQAGRATSNLTKIGASLLQARTRVLGGTAWSRDAQVDHGRDPGARVHRRDSLRRSSDFTRDISWAGRVLFVVRQDGFGVMGQVQVIESEDGQLEESLRELFIPIHEPSILARLRPAKGVGSWGRSSRPSGTRACSRRLGGPATSDSVAVPLIGQREGTAHGSVCGQPVERGGSGLVGGAGACSCFKQAWRWKRTSSSRGSSTTRTCAALAHRVEKDLVSSHFRRWLRSSAAPYP